VRTRSTSTPGQIIAPDSAGDTLETSLHYDFRGVEFDASNVGFFMSLHYNL
jgi:hypothetical protein